MGTNVFHSASDRIRQSGLVIPVTIVFFIGLLMSAAMMYEDYTTSLLGYQSLPTRKANEWVIPLVALLPQVGQIVFGYVFLADTGKKWALSITASLWLVDVVTDVAYKAGGMSLASYGVAAVESIIIYSVGSELLLVTCVGMLTDLLPSMVRFLFGGSANVPASKPVYPLSNKMPPDINFTPGFPVGGGPLSGGQPNTKGQQLQGGSKPVHKA